jgi:hypothetical protein
VAPSAGDLNTRKFTIGHHACKIAGTAIGASPLVSL